MSEVIDLSPVRTFLREFQDRATAQLEQLDGEVRFARDPWTQGQDNHGETRVLEGGAVFEKAGVNFSDIRGPALASAATDRHLHLVGLPFAAAGVSIVCHPRNPYAPTAHCNVRVFLAGEEHWWFGGGFDLTPYYGFDEDARHWHRCARQACAPYGEEVYGRYKRACDEYFFLPHRGETRGIGGLFFDDVNEWGFARTHAFIQDVAAQFLRAYTDIVKRRADLPYGDRERAFQQYRRGRYVEFNLLYDRGTLFGLQNSRRTESILMSLPPVCTWRYEYRADPGSPEAELTERFLGARDWLSEP